MILRFTKVSPTHHRFEYEVEGKTTTVELETKTYALHDFIHLALELEVPLYDSFYGKLATGESYQALSDPDAINTAVSSNSEIMDTERIVGALTSVIKDQTQPVDLIASMNNLYAALGVSLPEWLTVELVVRVKKRFNTLWGHWNGTPFGQTMEVTFDIIH